MTDELINNAEKFVCKLYKDNHCESVNELQAKKFWKCLQKNGKVIDLSLSPPCSSTLRKHTSQAHYIAKMWKLASYPLQNLDPFADNGWCVNGSIDWIECAFPSDVITLFCEEKESDTQSDVEEQEEDNYNIDNEDDDIDDIDKSDTEEE